VLLLSHPGINVVSAAELAGEMGPIANYAGPRSITGRAGLFPLTRNFEADARCSTLATKRSQSWTASAVRNLH
jgi:transposase